MKIDDFGGNSVSLPMWWDSFETGGLKALLYYQINLHNLLHNVPEYF